MNGIRNRCGKGRGCRFTELPFTAAPADINCGNFRGVFPIHRVRSGRPSVGKTIPINAADPAAEYRKAVG